MILNMERQMSRRVLSLGMAAIAAILTSCSTTESRISEHPEVYNTLSQRDQALVTQGKIRSGMSADAVWLAWGSPQRKIAGNMRGKETETWLYTTYETAHGYGYGPYAYPYGYPYYGYGFGVGVIRHHHHRSFFFYGDPFYDPFFYSYIPPSVEVPYKVATFSRGRVVSFQYLMTPNG
jgi:hypothetical protein